MKVQAATFEHHAWLISRVPSALSGAGARAIEAVDEAGTIHGMVGFYGWSPNSVMLDVAIDSPALCRGLLEATFDYVFNQSGRGLLLASIRSSNKRSVALARGVGMREAHRIKDGYSVGVDIIIFEMTRSECRWLRSKAQRAA